MKKEGTHGTFLPSFQLLVKNWTIPILAEHLVCSLITVSAQNLTQGVEWS